MTGANIASVTFFANGQQLGMGLAAPFEIFHSFSTGNYSLTATVLDSQGNVCTPTPVTLSDTDLSGPNALVGETSVGPTGDGDLPGVAEAIRYQGLSSGTANRVFLYLDSNSSCVPAVVGIYSDSGPNGAGNLLAQTSITAPVPSAWNVASIASVTITVNHAYWIALLCPAGSGTVYYRRTTVSPLTPDYGYGGNSLSTLPTSWINGADYSDTSVPDVFFAP